MVKIVSFLRSDGNRVEGRLVKENVKTAIVKPYKWLKMPEIKIHKTKQHMEFAGYSI